MDSSSWMAIKKVLGDALECPEEKRAAALDAACADDHVLRAEVERLLAAEARAANLLPTGSLEIAGRHHALQGSEGRSIGRYRLLHPIGEGGMGTVWLAEQERPQREVALKVLKGGDLSAELRRRFDIETSLLGRLQHSGIARIYEVGTVETDLGAQPFFAMEHVSGQSLTHFAEHAGLGVRQRLELLIKVADAVQHAHQKGIMHRDLKPANILVDETGHPKILDFGVARMVRTGESDGQPRTITGQLIGTIGYMSPEQCAADPDAVDIRTDIYALGVIGYELLAGRRPHELHDTPVLEAARIIREEEPLPLSAIRRSYRGDIETIIAKAMEKDRMRRYASASEFAADLNRHLRNEPISARPTSMFYQLKKFALRRRAMAAALAFLVLGGMGTSVGLVWALKERKHAKIEAQRNESIVTFFGNLLEPLKGGQSWGPNASIRDVLDKTARRVDEAFQDDPTAESYVRQVLARGYWGLEDFDQAAREFRRSLEIRRRLFEHKSHDVLFVANTLGDVLSAGGKAEEAESLALRWHEFCERQLGPDHVRTLWFAANLADALKAKGDFARAEWQYRAVVDLQRRDPNKYMDYAETLNSLARSLLLQGKQFEQAESFAREAHERTLKNLRQGPEDPAHHRAKTTLGWACHKRNKLDEAKIHLERAVIWMKNNRGNEHSDTLDAIKRLDDLRRTLLQEQPTQSDQ